MTTTVHVSWVPPSTPFRGVEIAMRVEGAPDFTVLAEVPNGTDFLDVPDLVDGQYEFQAVVISLFGTKRSGPEYASVTLESTPESVTGFTAVPVEV